MAEKDAIVRVLVRHRFHETDRIGRGFCGGPACGGGIVSVEAHAEHVADMLIAAGWRHHPWLSDELRVTPPVEDSGYCPDGCTWPHDHRFERDGIPWPARTTVIPPGEGV